MAGAKFLSTALEWTSLRGQTPDMQLVDASVNLYSHATNWEEANGIASDLIFPLFESLTQQHIETILRAPIENGADLRGSHSFARFIRQVRAEKIMKEGELDRLLEDNNLLDFMQTAPSRDDDLDDEIPF